MFRQRIDAIREKLAGIEKEMEEMCLETQESKKPRRHGFSWSAFEKEVVTEAFTLLVDSLAMRFERSKASIALFISNYMIKELRIKYEEKGE